jgi:flavin-dependent dehydrogenase
MTVPTSCDVVVAGGGVGGLTVATYLARLGYDVVLFEKHKHPRYQVGESTIPHVWRYLDQIGASDRIAREGFIQKAGGTTIWGGVIRQLAFKDFGFTRPALHIERDRFDFLLLEHARENGVRAFEEVAVLQADLDAGDRPRVLYRRAGDRATNWVECRYFVDASGQSALLGRQMGLRFVDEAFRFMSVWGFFDNAKYVTMGGGIRPFADLRTVPPTTFVTSLDGDQWGWAWHIPVRHATSVGLVLPRETMTHVRESNQALEALLVDQCRRTPVLGQLLEDARLIPGTFRVIRNYSYLSTQIAGPGFFLVGDAAAFVDPIFALGAVVSMYSACAAGEMLHRCLRQPAARERFQAIYTRQILQRVELARALALPCYQPTTPASDLARAALRLTSERERDLLNAATSLTRRNNNFLDMARDLGDLVGPSEKYAVLERIG